VRPESCIRRSQSLVSQAKPIRKSVRRHYNSASICPRSFSATRRCAMSRCVQGRSNAVTDRSRPDPGALPARVRPPARATSRPGASCRSFVPVRAYRNRSVAHIPRSPSSPRASSSVFAAGLVFRGVSASPSRLRNSVAVTTRARLARARSPTRRVSQGLASFGMTTRADVPVMSTGLCRERN